ncbi:MAG: DUF4391 domain-containing protein [Clostridia bacterium]
MFSLDDKYKVGKKIPMKDFIPKDLKATDKRKIKEYVKSCTLTYQISGENIPSLVNSEYNVQIIQFYDFEIEDIKKATFIANTYQNIIKSPCVIRLYNTTSEIYSFALKRLNQNDNSQVVVTDNLLTSDFMIGITSSIKQEFKNHLNFNKIIAKQNKNASYLEMYVKAYILTKDKLYVGAKDFLKRKDIWHNENKVRELYSNLRALELLNLSLFKAVGNADKVKINKEIKRLLEILEENADE